MMAIDTHNFGVSSMREEGFIRCPPLSQPAKRTADYRTVTRPLPDGSSLVVCLFGDTAGPTPAHGWSVVDISLVTQDRGSRTLCSLLVRQDPKHLSAPGTVSVMVFDPEAERIRANPRKEA